MDKYMISTVGKLVLQVTEDLERSMAAKAVSHTATALEEMVSVDVLSVRTIFHGVKATRAETDVEAKGHKNPRLQLRCSAVLTVPPQKIFQTRVILSKRGYQLIA